MYITYKFFAILRIIMVFIPQFGYIHPDEYFQSIEAIAEKLLQVETTQPREFNDTFPIHSICPLYLTVGLCLEILKILDYFVSHFFDTTLITPYFVIVCPRLLMCLLSFLVDWSLYKMCLINNDKYKSRCLVLATSYAMLTYATHTFSYSIELVLFALLLYYISASLILTTTNIKRYQYLDYRYKTATGPLGRAKFRKLLLCLENDSLRNWFAISVITVMGVFNRPSFIVYAAGPVLFWLLRGFGLKLVSPFSFCFRICSFLIGVIPSVILYIVIDSFYFGHLTWEEIGALKVSINNFVVTPWNFIKYNLDPYNIVKQKVHAYYFHAAWNMPMLFSILAFSFYSNIVQTAKYIYKSNFHDLPTVRSIRGLMVVSLIIPLFLLSSIPHQETRFIIPLLVPLVYLYGVNVLPESDNSPTRPSRATRRRSGRKTGLSYYMYRAWISFNILMTIFYGFAHQGGIYSFISEMNTEIKSTEYEYHIVTSHIYPIPESLFLQKPEQYEFNRPYLPEKRVNLHEQGSKDVNMVLNHIMHVFHYCEDKTGPPCSVHVVMPFPLVAEFENHRYQFYKDINIKNAIYFYPHISTEKLPTLPCIGNEQCLSLFGPDFYIYTKAFSLVRFDLQIRNKMFKVKLYGYRSEQY